MHIPYHHVKQTYPHLFARKEQRGVFNILGMFSAIPLALVLAFMDVPFFYVMIPTLILWWWGMHLFMTSRFYESPNKMVSSLLATIIKSKKGYIHWMASLAAMLEKSNSAFYQVPPHHAVIPFYES